MRLYSITDVSNRGRWHFEGFKNSSSSKNVASYGIWNSNSPVVKALKYHSSVESLLVSVRFLRFSHMILFSDTSPLRNFEKRKQEERKKDMLRIFAYKLKPIIFDNIFYKWMLNLFWKGIWETLTGHPEAPSDV